MKIYKVKVNGKLYEVELESVTETNLKIEEPQVQVKNEPVIQKLDTGSALTSVKAPMQGNIIDVKVNVGASVKKGQTVVVLEAMKLENNIVSPVDGVVREVLVSKGTSVKNQQVILTIQ